MTAQAIPRAPEFDGTPALLREGYGFISARCDALKSDIFATRLMLRPVICVRGAEAAEMFYGGDHFTRAGALPQTTLRLLQDKGSVQLLDGAAHRHRKAMFHAILLDETQVVRLRESFSRHWREALSDWQARGELSLFEAANLVLARAVADWMNLPAEVDRTRLWRSLSGMIENAAGIGPRTWLALWRRRRTEKVVGTVVRQVRNGALSLPTDSPFRIICDHRQADGALLDVPTATVEIINILRPVVAIGRFIMFAAMALHDNPGWTERFASGSDEGLGAFVEETRRRYPFFPFVGGRARHAFGWKNYSFRKGDWVLLDIFGTLHDPRHFPAPEQFLPERNLSWATQDFEFIPQGGGCAAVTHRCPGEAVTVALVEQSIRLLTRSMTYDVPPQALDYSLARIPARPRERFRITAVKKAQGGCD